MNSTFSSDSFFQSLRRDGQARWQTDSARPWGSSIVMGDASRDGSIFLRERLLEIAAFHYIRLHKHLGFDEMWIGSRAFVYFLEDASGNIIEQLAQTHERIVVPRGRQHAIVAGREPLTIFEIQTGTIQSDDNIKSDYSALIDGRMECLSVV